MFKDKKEGTTHYYGDCCGEPAHNMTQEPSKEKKLDIYCGKCGFHKAINHECPIEKPRLWEERFDEDFVDSNGPDVEPSFRDPHGDVGPVISFIRQVEQDTREAMLKEVMEEILRIPELEKEESESCENCKGIDAEVKKFGRSMSTCTGHTSRHERILGIIQSKL